MKGGKRKGAGRPKSLHSKINLNLRVYPEAVESIKEFSKEKNNEISKTLSPA
jgi:hypothetical protein